MRPTTCVLPEGKFTYGVHKPGFKVKNLRGSSRISVIGRDEDGQPVTNHANFPKGDVEVPQGDWVYEIPNAFPHKGAAYISGYFADLSAKHPESISIPLPENVSLADTLGRWTGAAEKGREQIANLYESMPQPLQLALAVHSTDPDELAALAKISCRFTHDAVSGAPDGLVYKKNAAGTPRAVVLDHELFKALANNAFLPESYRKAMVLIPGVQGGNEITAEWQSPDGASHIYEYFRRNSYIPWGHFAANMAEDSVRYHLRELTATDMEGLRHLYYQRTYVRLAGMLGLSVSDAAGGLDEGRLEEYRNRVCDAISYGKNTDGPEFAVTLWGWNYGFGYTPDGYRMHGSHQQIHQQYALIPADLPVNDGSAYGAGLFSYANGNPVADFIQAYRKETGKRFFDAYIKAIRNHTRLDGNKEGESDLVVWEDENVIVFVPVAQTSQWELQVMAVKPVGNILEADTSMRSSFNRGIYTAVSVLSAMGAKMITGIECSKRFGNPDSDQRLFYSFLPRLPQAPGAFSEAQHRWINRHFPEDFASVCRNRLQVLSGR